ncbi:hypothetical protein ES332_A05G351500v1 [Gossypium tomentosum]|uniref:Lipase-like C-terminal domain-containing protein n=1 Tax=Gossypium tomentosum TaxID=34277 RepID=A0A5D2QNH3_GOSTO|nr:hypothetical protein ES332_A05G351500v1 [Gossypium tomentosum]
MIRWCISSFQLAELFISSVVHLLYGFYVYSTAVAADLSQALSECVFKSNVSLEVKKQDPNKSTVDDLPPIVLVHGIFGFGKGKFGSFSYFGGAEKKDERVLVPDLGSLTSIYDRARELFYYLKGGRVDYGEQHSKTCGHSRFGRIYEQGHYPQWDEDHPIHFVGHSAGAQVVRVLQQMLADKAFEGYENTSENWVLSITALSGAFNGTTRTYLDGMLPEDGQNMKPLCLLQLCRLGVIIYDWLDIPLLKAYYNFGYATKRTRKILGVTVPSGILGIHPMLFMRVLQMSLYRYPTDVPPPYKGYRDEDWQDNDGALNTISMTHPRLPIEHPSCSIVNDSDCQPLQPGIWYYKIVEADHILFILNRERAGVQFDLMYDNIFERCRKHIFRKTSQTLPNEAP